VDQNDPEIKRAIEEAVKEAGKLAGIGQQAAAVKKIKAIQKKIPNFSSADANSILVRSNLSNEALALNQALLDQGLEDIAEEAAVPPILTTPQPQAKPNNSAPASPAQKPNNAPASQTPPLSPKQDTPKQDNGEDQESKPENQTDPGLNSTTNASTPPATAEGEINMATSEAPAISKKGTRPAKGEEQLDIDTDDADSGESSNETPAEPTGEPNEDEALVETVEAVTPVDEERAKHPNPNNVDALFRPTNESYVDIEEKEGISGGPSVVISGPSTIYPRQNIIYTAKTENLNEAETYKWGIEGKVRGVTVSGTESNSGNITISTEENCGKGIITISAFGEKSEASDQVNVYIRNKDDRKSRVKIDGPNTLYADASIILTATTEGFDEKETYFWNHEGRVNGLSYTTTSAESDGSSNGYKITASPNCGKGAVTILAKGNKSKASSGGFNIIVINKKKKEDEEEEEKEDEDEEKKKKKEKEEERKKGKKGKKEEPEGTNKGEAKAPKGGAAAEGGAAKGGIGKALAALAKNPYFWLGVLILLVAIGLFAWFYYLSKSGANGKKPTIPANVIDNKTAIEKLNILVGNINAQSQITHNIIQQSQENLLAIKEETSDQALLTMVDEALTLIDEYNTSEDPETGQKIIDKVKEIIKKMSNSIPQIQGRYPVDPNQITGFNNDLHLGTPLRPETPSYDKGHGTYMYPGEKKCDAVDIYTLNSVPVYPAITGSVVDVSDDGTGNKKIVIKNGDYELLYANIKVNVKVGDAISDLNQAIGNTVNINGYYQIHIELSYCGVCLITSPLDQIDKNKNDSAPWGEYLWSHIKETLKLP